MLSVAALGATFLLMAGCGPVELGVDYPVGVYGDDYPPDAYLATNAPYYYNGQASYYWGGSWYYRNGGGWNHYRTEPEGLRRQRMRGGARPGYRYSAGRGGGGRGGGGGHGGGHGGGGRR